tara:strand:- start:27 stop:206 length:180 start_codon:yes stop_codon:yes gene_type:complete
MKDLPEVMTVAVVMIFFIVIILMFTTGCTITYTRETPSPTEAILSNTVVTTTTTSTTGT